MKYIQSVIHSFILLMKNASQNIKGHIWSNTSHFFIELCLFTGNTIIEEKLLTCNYSVNKFFILVFFSQL